MMLGFKPYNSNIPVLFLLRFITILTHLVIIILIFTDRDNNVKASLPVQYATSDFNTIDTNLIIWLSLSVAFIFVELVSFILLVTSLAVYQAFISIVCHAIAVFSLFPYYVDSWPSDQIKWIFGFCTVLPCLLEFYIYFDMFALKKHYP